LSYDENQLRSTRPWRRKDDQRIGNNEVIAQATEEITEGSALAGPALTDKT